MTNVIYADVLFVINTYVTYILLVLTSLFAHEKARRLRLIFASLFGGAVSFLILLPEVNGVFLSLCRILFAFFFLLIPFGRVGKRRFLRLYGGFFLVNFIFAGLMLALWYFLSPGSMYYIGGVVYFGIDSLSLILMTAVCYGLIRLISRFLRTKAPEGRVYDVKITAAGREISCRGFLDTGNSLRDPFSGFPVIAVAFDKLSELFPSGYTPENAEVKARYLPCSTVAGNELLLCFTADRVSLQGIGFRGETDRAVIAVAREKICSGEFDAILPADIFKNTINERGEEYDNKTANPI